MPKSTVSFIGHLAVAGSDDGIEFIDAGARVTPVLTMVANLAEALNSLLDRPVVDRTGLKGRYGIDLPSWNPGLPLRDRSADPDPEPQPDPGAPSISTVLQQLGLRLEPIRGPLDIYVVDRIERPTPN